MTKSVCSPDKARPSHDGRRSKRKSGASRRRAQSSPRQREDAASGQIAAKTAADATDFAALGLSRPLLAALERVGFQRPTDIQRELIPPALAGRDCLGQARTGTGKTAAFVLPILHRVQPGRGVQALVLAPTRELAAQVGEQVRLLSPAAPPRTLVVFGGVGIGANLRDLKRGVDVVVGTPGRILDLIQRNALDLSGVKLAVLDEVDRMLDIGFRDSIRRIMANVASDRQTIFVSATMTADIRRLAHGLMREAVEVNVSADCLTVDQVRQDYLTVEPGDKPEALREYLRQTAPNLAIVFTRTKRGAAKVAKQLARANVASAEIHGGLTQGRRTRVLNDLRGGRIKVLVATDLASRGLDVTGVSHIVNYDIPADPAVYVHRIGRTARMGARGHAVTFVTPEQGRELTDIERLIDQPLNRVDRPGSARGDAPPMRESTAVVEQSPTAHASPSAAACRAATAEPDIARPRRTLGSRFPRARRRR